MTLPRLNQAHRHVLGELGDLGLWSDAMAQVQVWLRPFATTASAGRTMVPQATFTSQPWPDRVSSPNLVSQKVAPFANWSAMSGRIITIHW